jgi:hypothetical protein
VSAIALICLIDFLRSFALEAEAEALPGLALVIIVSVLAPELGAGNDSELTTSSDM